MKGWQFSRYPIDGFSLGIEGSIIDLHDECGRVARFAIDLIVIGFEAEYYLGPTREPYTEHDKVEFCSNPEMHEYFALDDEGVLWDVQTNNAILELPRASTLNGRATESKSGG